MSLTTTSFYAIKCFIGGLCIMKYHITYWLVIEWTLSNLIWKILTLTLSYFGTFFVVVEMVKMHKRVKCLDQKLVYSMETIWCLIKYWMHNECNPRKVVDRFMMSIYLLSRIKVNILLGKSDDNMKSFSTALKC